MTQTRTFLATVSHFFTDQERSAYRTGLLMGLEALLEVKFEEPGLALMRSVKTMNQIPTIEGIFRAVKRAAALDDVRKFLPNASLASNDAGL
jgi:hypothetical protein